eukprot:1909440-Amphidinium_carterae.5
MKPSQHAGSGSNPSLIIQLDPPKHVRGSVKGSTPTPPSKRKGQNSDFKAFNSPPPVLKLGAVTEKEQNHHYNLSTRPQHPPAQNKAEGQSMH